MAFVPDFSKYVVLRPTAVICGPIVLGASTAVGKQLRRPPSQRNPIKFSIPFPKAGLPGSIQLP